MATSAFREAFTELDSEFVSCPPKGMTYTENGALALDGTGTACLDFFSTVMARDKDTAMPDDKIQSCLAAAWEENPALTLRLIAHLRDVRGGKGERHAGQVCWTWLLTNHPKQVRKNIGHIPFFGRWKDLLDIFCGTPLEELALEVFSLQLVQDHTNLVLAQATDDPVERCTYLGKISLAAKWAPTEKCSHDKIAKAAQRVPPSFLLAQFTLDNDQDQVDRPLVRNTLMKWFRTKYLSPLRKSIDLVETHLCSKEFDLIDFSKVPGVALKMYSKKTFPTHMKKRFREWQQDVLAGKAKMNSGTVDPYEVVHLFMTGRATEAQKLTLEAFYHDQVRKLRACGTDLGSSVVVADVSGSMLGTPMEVSVAMAIWISSLASEAWRDLFFTFETEPSIVDLSGCKGLEDRVQMTQKATWGGSTNLQATLDLILSRSLERKLTDDQMPKRLVIVSDMQFDVACSDGRDGTDLFTNLEVMRAKFRAAGYTMPVVVFWNVRGNTHGGSPASGTDQGVVILSGFSKSMITLLLKGGDIPTPLSVMLETLSDERYDRMTLV